MSCFSRPFDGRHESCPWGRIRMEVPCLERLMDPLWVCRNNEKKLLRGAVVNQAEPELLFLLVGPTVVSRGAGSGQLITRQTRANAKHIPSLCQLAQHGLIRPMTSGSLEVGFGANTGNTKLRSNSPEAIIQSRRQEGSGERSAPCRIERRSYRYIGYSVFLRASRSPEIPASWRLGRVASLCRWRRA